MSAPRPLMPFDAMIVAILVERLGGRVVISDEELASFDRRGTLVQHGTVDGFVVEIHRPPLTVSGEVVRGEVLALPVSEIMDGAADSRMRA